MARILEISHLSPGLKKKKKKKHFLLHWLVVVMQSHTCCMSEKVFYLVMYMYVCMYMICLFLGIELSKLYFSQHFKM